MTEIVFHIICFPLNAATVWILPSLTSSRCLIFVRVFFHNYFQYGSVTLVFPTVNFRLNPKSILLFLGLFHQHISSAINLDDPQSNDLLHFCQKAFRRPVVNCSPMHSSTSCSPISLIHTFVYVPFISFSKFSKYAGRFRNGFMFAYVWFYPLLVGKCLIRKRALKRRIRHNQQWLYGKTTLASR